MLAQASEQPYLGGKQLPNVGQVSAPVVVHKDGVRLDCPAGGVLENEPVCGDEYSDTWNGGCNSAPEVFQTIACGQTICGESGTYLFGGNNYRDTDWFELVADGQNIYNWTVTADFPVLAFVLGPPCTNIQVFGQATGDPGVPAVVETACLPAGTYWVWVGPSVFTGVDCGADWVGTLTCTPCVIPLGACCLFGGECVDAQTQDQCLALNGNWQGQDVMCANIECPAAGPNFVVDAPGQWSADTCESTNQCTLRPSQDYMYEVHIANGGEWVFELCEANFYFDTYLFVGTSLCSADVAYDDDGCPTNGLQSTLTVTIPAGTYYVTVEAYSSDGCGQYTLSIYQNLPGACCLFDGTCVDGLTGPECVARNGIFQGGGTSCTAIECPTHEANFVVEAPGCWSADSCEYTNQCTLRPSQDVMYEVNIPTDGEWVFSLCQADFYFDTYLFVGDALCSSDIGYNDDFCNPNSLQSQVTANLSAGTYYVTVEAYGSTSCGQYTLCIALNLGACCVSGVCTGTMGSQDCANNGGVWFFGENCNTYVCPTVECPAICGDLEPDGDVDLDDYYLFVAAFGSCTGDENFNPLADMDHDGCVTLVDYQMWIDCYRNPHSTAMIEGEPVCGDNYVDTWNGGCNSAPPVFQTVACGMTVCGESGNFNYNGNQYRDTDWFELVLTTQNYVTWSVTAEFPLLTFIIDGTGGCSNMVTLGSASADPFQPATITTECLPAGTYWLWAGPSVFGTVPCGARYVATITCVGCYIPTGACCYADQSCADGLSVEQCGNTGGTFMGDDTICDNIECPECIECLPGSTPEGEPVCGDEYADTWNGGCNSNPVVFQPIACGQMYCAESGTYLFQGNSYRDTDWFEYVATEATTLTWTVDAEFPVLAFILDGTPGCAGLVVLSSGTANPCQSIVLTADVGPGTYWLWAGPSVFTGVNCGAGYTGLLTCGGGRTAHPTGIGSNQMPVAAERAAVGDAKVQN